MMDKTNMLEITNLSKFYGTSEVLSIPDLKIKKGECVLLLGDNGAGKTTLIKSILDLIKINNGEILIDGLHVRKTEKWKDKTATFLNSNLLIPYLTPYEYLCFVSDMRGINRLETNNFIEKNRDFYKDELFNDSKKLIRDLSQGNQQKVGIMSSLLGNSHLIVMDEPYVNLDMSSKDKLSKMIALNNEKSSTFIISSHNLDNALRVATRILILKKGRIIQDISPKDYEKEEIEKLVIS